MSVDIEQASAAIASDLGMGVDNPPAEDVVVDSLPDKPEALVAEPVVRKAPSSWAKEYHDSWGKLDPKVQEYVELREKQMLDGLEQYKEHSTLGKTLREVITPYKAMIDAAGLDEAKAVQYLMNAHYRLTNGTPEQRFAYLQQLGANLGLVQPQQQQQVDPAVKALKDQVDHLTNSLTQRQKADFEATQKRVSENVMSFAEAKDDKGNLTHPYFDEVAEDIVTFIGAGMELDKAYDKAVYANPVTRAKELARLQTEAEAKLREKSKQEVQKARQASSTNVRSRDTTKAPTEPLGKMDDTLKETLSEIRSRPH